MAGNAAGGTLLIGALLGIVMVAVVFGGEAAVSTTEFCTSCHSMTYPAEELKTSSHYGALGANPGCKDCHIPQGFKNFHLAVATHVVDGARELYLEFANDYSTLEKFNERRLIMAHDARMNLKKWDSNTCRECHKNPQPPGCRCQGCAQEDGDRGRHLHRLPSEPGAQGSRRDRPQRQPQGRQNGPQTRKEG